MYGTHAWPFDWLVGWLVNRGDTPKVYNRWVYGTWHRPLYSSQKDIIVGTVGKAWDFLGMLDALSPTWINEQRPMAQRTATSPGRELWTMDQPRKYLNGYGHIWTM